MALKDYKQLKNLKKTTYQNLKRNEWVVVEKVKRGMALTPYFLYSIRNGMIKKLGYYKTKTLALKNAKSYMRSN